VPTAVPPEPTETPTAAPKRSPKPAAAAPTASPEPTATHEPTATPEPTVKPEPTARPSPSPIATRKPKKGAKPEAAIPTATPTPEEAVEEEERPPEQTPEAEPSEEERGEAPPALEAPAAGAGKSTEGEPQKRGASRVSPSGGKSDVELPSVEIQGELEKPDIFFVLPRARDQSDEQLMRARIRREITRPVIKDWIEEEMLLK
jgi:hypothetical protein